MTERSRQLHTTSNQRNAGQRGWWLLCALCFALFPLLSCSTARPPEAKADAIPKKSWEEIAGAESSDSQNRYALAKQIATITDKKLNEISGLTAGRANKNIWWAINDSGSPAEIHAIDASGKLLATFTVTGAKNRDWEDLGSGPGGDGKPVLYLADIGDNGARRTEAVIWRVGEPQLKSGVKSGKTEAAEKFPFKYPDGAHDAEAVFADPSNGRLYVITKAKVGGLCGVYRFPLPLTAGKLVTLEKVRGKFVSEIEKLPLVTGAAVSPDGSRLAIRTYFSAIEFQRAKGKTFEAMFDSAPVTISLPLERQGEAIAYTADGKAIVTTTERVPAPLYQMTRR